MSAGMVSFLQRAFAEQVSSDLGRGLQRHEESLRFSGRLEQYVGFMQARSNMSLRIDGALIRICEAQMLCSSNSSRASSVHARRADA